MYSEYCLSLPWVYVLAASTRLSRVLAVTHVRSFGSSNLSISCDWLAIIYTTKKILDRFPARMWQAEEGASLIGRWRCANQWTVRQSLD